MSLDSTWLSLGAKLDLKLGQAKIYQFWCDAADITENKQKNEWVAILVSVYEGQLTTSYIDRCADLG